MTVVWKTDPLAADQYVGYVGAGKRFPLARVKWLAEERGIAAGWSAYNLTGNFAHQTESCETPSVVQWFKSANGDVLVFDSATEAMDAVEAEWNAWNARLGLVERTGSPRRDEA